MAAEQTARTNKVNNNMLNLKPAPLLDAKHKPTGELHQVRDPITTAPLATDGQSKPNNKYWRARLREGSVIDTDAPTKAKAQQKSIDQANQVRADRAAASTPKTTKES